MLLFLSALGWAAEPVGYLNAVSVQAEKQMQQLASRDPAKLSQNEKIDWARARMAWVDLLRLQGRDEEALQVFAGCLGYCEKFGGEKEWKPMLAWGCGKKPDSKPCKKTKAQKPPH